METHTILFLQPKSEISSRTFTDFEGITECVLGICTIYERTLKMNKTQTGPDLKYTLNDLYAYMDNFIDLSCLVYEGTSGEYAPHDKSWIKKMVYMTLSELAIPRNASPTLPKKKSSIVIIH